MYVVPTNVLRHFAHFTSFGILNVLHRIYRIHGPIGVRIYIRFDPPMWYTVLTITGILLLYFCVMRALIELCRIVELWCIYKKAKIIPVPEARETDEVATVEATEIVTVCVNVIV